MSAARSAGVGSAGVQLPGPPRSVASSRLEPPSIRSQLERTGETVAERGVATGSALRARRLSSSSVVFRARVTLTVIGAGPTSFRWIGEGTLRGRGDTGSAVIVSRGVAWRLRWRGGSASSSRGSSRARSKSWVPVPGMRVGAGVLPTPRAEGGRLGPRSRTGWRPAEDSAIGSGRGRGGRRDALELRAPAVEAGAWELSRGELAEGTISSYAVVSAWWEGEFDLCFLRDWPSGGVATALLGVTEELARAPLSGVPGVFT